MDFSKMAIGEIASLPVFANFEYLIGEENPAMAPMVNAATIESVCQMIPVWDSASLTEGIEYLYERAQEKQILFDIYDEDGKTPENAATGIACFTVPGDEKVPYVVILAGGSYRHCCKIQEGFPVAKRLNEMGIAAFVVQYRTGKVFEFDGAMEDVAQGIRFIRENADELNVNPDDYAVMGYSAGGHIAALWGTNHLGFKAHDLPAPGALLLGYPVVTLEPLSHYKEKLTDIAVKDWSPEAMSYCSVMEHADADYPRTFVFAFEDDNTVPKPASGKVLCDYLDKAGIENVCQLFPGELHGTGLSDHTIAKGWLNDAVDFWRKPLV